MTSTSKCIVTFFLIVLASCQTNNEKSRQDEKRAMVKDTVPAPAINKFPGIQFASKKDTSCGMPLSAGLEDTVVLKGKIYGFCSAECKEDFINKLIAQHKR